MPRFRVVIIAIVAVLVVGLLWFFLHTEKPIVNGDSEGTDIIAFGDSLIEGVGAEYGMALPDQLGFKLGVPVVNAGVAGSTTHDGVVTIRDALDGYRPRIVILSLGGNDFLKKVPRDEIKRNLGNIIEEIQRHGAMVVLLGVRSGIIGGGFDDEFEELAERYGAVYVEDVLSGIFGDTRYMSDGVHPNAAGYGIIADRIVDALVKQDIRVR